jgi:hypothetical protein
MLRSFDACLAVGRRNADYYRHYGVADAHIHRSVHCVDGDFLRAADTRRRRHEVRRELGLPADTVVFMFAGKLTEKSGRSISGSAPARAPTHKDVWGLCQRWSAEGGGRRLPASTRSCALAGFQSQRRIAATYAAADVLVLPSTSGETWGRS